MKEMNWKEMDRKKRSSDSPVKGGMKRGKGEKVIKREEKTCHSFFCQMSAKNWNKIVYDKQITKPNKGNKVNITRRQTDRLSQHGRLRAAETQAAQQDHRRQRHFRQDRRTKTTTGR
ncbi:hypothetical protein ElyMa_004166500 [Elysia marginata]|uniref:Uncharacterized protein n=1 Tax=Elysia marginata TaxID=1093978 RepID=A0AAV4GI33_9GAST|nr:hypothetical protein ElyMa_004166500 [Elysia marginata]